MASKSDIIMVLIIVCALIFLSIFCYLWVFAADYSLKTPILSKENIIFMGSEWSDKNLFNNPYWCYASNAPKSGWIELKYRIVNFPSTFLAAIYCKTFDNSSFEYEMMPFYKSSEMDNRYIIANLELNINHNLTICCHLQDFYGSPMSNDTCFTQRIDKVKCDRRPPSEEEVVPPYFQE